MTEKPRPIRRVVTGNDEQGRSRVLFDSAAPNVNPGAVSARAGMTDIWVFHSCPAVISGDRDDGKLPFHFEPRKKAGICASSSLCGTAEGLRSRTRRFRRAAARGA